MISVQAVGRTGERRCPRALAFRGCGRFHYA